MIILWILLFLAVLLLLTGLILLLSVCGRGAMKQAELDAFLANAPCAGFREEMQTCIDWVHAQEQEELRLLSYDDKRLHATFLPRENARGTILLFHGYRSSWEIDFSVSIRFYLEQGFNVLLVDQRSHGRSQGRFITFGVRERFDVLSWATYLAQMLGEDHPLYLLGLSMGATTVLMASHFDFPANVRGVIADCGFTSPYAIIRSVAEKRAPRFLVPAVLFLLDLAARLFAGFGLRETSTTDALAETKLPVLLCHGTADGFVPYTMSEEAYRACAGEKKLLLVEGANHGQSYLADRPRIQREIAAFLQAHLPQESSVQN